MTVFTEQQLDEFDDRSTLACGIDVDNAPEASEIIPVVQGQDRALTGPLPPLLSPKKISDEYMMMNAVACTSTKFLERKLTVPEILIGCFRVQSLSMVYAKAGVGKSWFIHYVILCLTRNDYSKALLGPWPVEKPCGVLLLDGELPNGEFQNRIKLLKLELGEESTNNPLTIITAEDMANITDSPINICDRRWRDGITEYVTTRQEIELIVIDNVSSFTPGINENIKHDWDPINQWLLSLRRKGYAVIMIHHAGKSGTDRGHSGRVDNLDNVLILENDSEQTEGLRIKVKFEKGRSLLPDQKASFSLELVPGPNGGLIIKEAASAALQKERLKELIKLLHAKNTQKQIGTKLGICQSRVSQLKKDAYDAGFILEDGTLSQLGKEWIGDSSCSDININPPTHSD